MKSVILVIAKNSKSAMHLFEDYLEPLLNVVSKKVDVIETDNLTIYLKNVNDLASLRGYKPKCVYVDDHVTNEQYNFIYHIMKDHTKIVVI